MKRNLLYETVFTFLPIVSLVIAFGIVFYQYNRRTELSDELNRTTGEFNRCVIQYNKLRGEWLKKHPPAATPSNLSMRQTG